MKTIIYFLLLLSILDHLPAGSSYRKYIRIFGGFVLILLVIRPVMELLDSEGHFSYYLDISNLFAESYDYSAEITGGEQLREDALMKEYQEAIKERTSELLERKGYEARTVRVQMGTDQADDDYGKLTGLYVEAFSGEDRTEAELQSEPPGSVSIGRIEIARIEVGTDSEQDSKRISTAEEIALAGYLAEYYGMEESAVTVRIIT